MALDEKECTNRGLIGAAKGAAFRHQRRAHLTRRMGCQTRCTIVVIAAVSKIHSR